MPTREEVIAHLKAQKRLASMGQKQPSFADKVNTAMRDVFPVWMVGDESGDNSLPDLMGKAFNNRLIGTGQLIAEATGNADADLYKRSQSMATANKEALARAGGTGIVADIIADPLNLLAGAGAAKKIASAPSVLSKVGALAMAGAGGGAVAGGTSALGEGEDRLQKAIEGAATGAITTPLVYGGAKIGASLAKLPKRIVDAVRIPFSDTVAQKRAINIIGKRLARDGFNAGEVQDLVAKIKQSGIDATLGEATQSSSLLQAEKNILRGTGKGANTMREFVADRAVGNIPRQMRARADALIKAGEQLPSLKSKATEAFYGKYPDAGKPIEKTVTPMDRVAALEGKGLILPDSFKRGIEDSYVPPVTKDDPLRSITNNTINAINDKIEYLGNLDDIEKKTLVQAKKILENARRHGNTFQDLLTAKRKIQALRVEGFDTYSQIEARRIAEKNTKQLNETLSELGGESYGAFNKKAQEMIAGKDLAEILGNNPNDSLNRLYNQVWSTPALRQDFLRKLPDEATKESFTNFFESLGKVRRGFGGSDTAFNIAGAAELADEAGLGAPIVKPSIGNILGSLTRNLDEALQGRTYDKMANITTGGNVAEVAEAMRRAAMPESQGYARSAIRAGMQTGEGQPQQEAVAPQSPQMQTPSREEVIQFLKQKMRQQSSTPQSSYLDRVRQTESGGNPNAQSATSSASGLYQFTDQTWNSMVKKYGERTGITADMKNDPQAQEIFARLLTQENAQSLSKMLGRQPSEDELYLAHFLGAGGAKRMLKIKNPNAPAARVFPRAASANKSIFYDGKRQRTVGEVMNIITRKV
jgi:hypothetical protein